MNPWIAYIDPKPKAALRIFCFPYAGGGASLFRRWSEEVPASIEICAVQPPGRETRYSEPPFEHIGSLVEELHSALRGLLDKRYAFFGYSMGALIAFELARLVRRDPRSAGLCHLFVAAARGPRLRDPHPVDPSLSDAEFIHEVNALGGISPEVMDSTELLECHMELLRADFGICARYEYLNAPALDCPISAFGGIEDARISQQDLQAWANETSAAFSSRLFAGDHFFIHSHRRTLLQTMLKELSTSVKHPVSI